MLSGERTHDSAGMSFWQSVSLGPIWPVTDLQRFYVPRLVTGGCGCAPQFQRAIFFGCGCLAGFHRAVVTLSLAVSLCTLSLGVRLGHWFMALFGSAFSRPPWGA